MRKIDKPWGHEVIWAETDNYVGKILHIDAGHRLSLQYHNFKEETIYVMEGTLLAWSEEEGAVTVNKGDTWYNEPGRIHRFGAPQDADVVLLEVSTPHLNDVIRLEDDYEREQDGCN